MADAPVIFQHQNGLQEIDGIVTPVYGSSADTVAEGNDARFSIDNVIRVKKNPGPGEFGSWAAALASITTNSVSNPFLVQGGPGIYIEPQLVMKPYVYFEGLGEFESVVITPSDPLDHLVIGSDFSAIKGILFTGTTAPNKALIYHDSPTGTTQTSFWLENCRFGASDILVWANATTSPSSIFINNCRFGGEFSFRQGFVATNAGSGFAGRVIVRGSTTQSLQAPLPDDIYFTTGSGCEIVINSVQTRSGTMTTGNCIRIADGARLRALGINIRGFGTGLKIDAGGAAPQLSGGVYIFELCTQDIDIQHTGTTGAIIGSAEESKVTFLSSLVGYSLIDPVTGSLLISKSLKVNQGGFFTDTSTLITEASTMGVMEGGAITPAGGFDVTVGAGFGYLEVEPEILKRFDWPDTTITLPSNSNLYLFFNSSGVLVTSGSFPDTHLIILAGRVKTNTSGVEFIDGTGLDAEHTSNLFDKLLRRAIGPIYESGSIVTESGTRNLDITGGTRFLSTRELVTSGGTGLSWLAYRSDGIGGFIHANQSTVDNAFWDDGTGTLAALGAGFYAKHSLYVVGNAVDGTEKYLLVYSQAQYASLTIAEQSNIPTPPSSFTEGVTLLATLLVQQGVSSISEIRDERPRIGFVASGVSASSVHGNLLGLLADDHPQYLRTDGTRVLTGSQNFGGNNATNVGTVNGVTVEAHATRHNPGGADALATAAPVTQNPDQANAEGIAASFARSDHVHNIPADTAVGLSPASTSTEGTSTSFGRADHTHAVATALVGDITTIQPDDAAVAGTANTYARGDHKHAIVADPPVTITDSTNAEGTATSFARSDHQHSHGSRGGGALHALVTTLVNGFMSAVDKVKLDASGILTSTAPVNVTKAAAAVGISTESARADHKHDVTTAAASGQTPDQASAEGTATSLARSDHIHNIPTAVVTDIGSANAQGSAASFAKSDHVHKGIHSLKVGAGGTQRFGDIVFLSGENITIIDDGAGNFTVAGYAGTATVNTTDNTATTILTIATATDKTYMIEAAVVARRTGGSSGTAGDSATYIRTTKAKNVAGTLTVATPQTSFTDEDQAPWNATIDGSGTNIRVRVTGANNNNVSWSCSYRIWSV